MVHTYNVISEDGFIARRDGSEDFIPDELWERTLDVFRMYDVLVMGRKTYEALQKYDQESLQKFEKLKVRKIVVTQDKNFQVRPGYEVSTNLKEIVSSKQKILVSSGPNLNNYLLKENLIKEIIFHQVPVKIGEGIKPFDTDVFHAPKVDIDKFGIKQIVYIFPNTD